MNALTLAYIQTDSLKKAELLLQKVQDNLEKNTTGVFKRGYLDVLKNLAFKKQNYTKAIKLGEKHFKLLNSMNHYEEKLGAHHFLAKVYETVGNNKKSLNHLKIYTKVKDSISNVQKTNALLYYQTLYETEKRDTKIITQKSNIELLNTQNKIKKQWLLFGGLSLLGMFLLFYFYRSKNFIKQQKVQQEKYSQNLLIAQEEERKRISRDLHDSIGQNLMLLKRKASKDKNTELENLASNTLEEMRTITKALHPSILEKLGLTTAITSFINDVDNNTEIFFTQEIDNIDGLITKENEVHLFRIIQECVTNLVKHSNSKVAFIKIKKENSKLFINIEDKGKGFNFEEKGTFSYSLGMKTLEERSSILNAIFNVKSKKGIGTNLEFVIPVNIKPV
jgi:signal transduction histidine kinase